LLNKSGGFTLVEILVVTLLFTIIIGSLLVTLTTGQLSTAVGSAKADLQAKLRNIMGLLVRDVRQTNILEINTHSPTIDHIQFRKVTGIDASGNYTLDTYFIVYTYDSGLKQLTRQGDDGAGHTVTTTWDNITQSPFYVASGEPLAANNILTYKKLRIVIAGESTVRTSLVLTFTLTEEVKIRNE
jgi:hypothetical protein